MIIREFCKNDLAKIDKFEKEIFKDDSYTLESLNNFLEDDYFLGTVAEVNGEVIAYLFVSYFGVDANILKIAVDYKYRNRGIAKKLLLEMFDLLKENCVENLFLEVDDQNEPALNLYKSLGFENTRIRYAYYKNGDNAIEMIKKL